MDLFKRIQDLSAIYDDDGPSAMVPESRPMFNNGGMLVQPSVDGSRPGYAKDYNVEELDKATEYYTQGEYKKFNDIKGFGQSKDPEFIKKYKNIRSLIKKQLDYHDGKFVIPDKTRVKKTDQTIELEKFLKGKKTIKQSELIKKLTELGYKDPKLYVNTLSSKKNINIIRDVERAPQPERKSKIYSEAQLNKASKGMFDGKTYDQLSNIEKSKVRSKLFNQGGKYSKFRKINNPLSKELIKDIKTKYGNVYKDWDFDNYRFGITDAKGKNSKLYDKIKNFVAEPKPYELTADLKSADGWMGHQMNRAFKLGDDRYTPIKIIRNGKEKIAGFIDNTEFGNGKKYIFSEEFIKGSNADGVLMSSHPDYKNTKKFVDIADKAKVPVQGALKNILKSKGVDTSRISLSDLYKYMMDQVGIEGTKNAIEKHHIKGVGVRATGDYQLLNRDLNILARDISAEIADGNLSRVDDLKKKGVRVNIGGVDFGATSNKPSSDFLKIKDEVTSFYKNDPNAKNVIKKLMVFCPAGTATVTKAGGGRVPYADGPVCTPDEAIRGMNEEFDKLKKGNATTGEASRTVNKFKNLGVKGMSGLLKAGLVSEVAYEAAVGFDKVISEGQSPMQAFRQSYLTAPLRAIGAMKSFEEGEREEILDAARDKDKVGRVLDLQNLVGDKNKLASNIQGLKSNVENLQRLDDGDFGYMGGTQGQENALASAQANLQDMYRSGELSKAEQLFSTKPQDLKLKDKTLMDAYNDAIEKRKNIQAERSSIAQSIAADKNRIRDANKAMLEKFPIYTPEIIDSMYERAKVEKPENLDIDIFNNIMRDQDKMNYFADNFRTEKAGGGIAGLSGGDPKGAMTTSMNPDSQGLQGLFNRVKKV